MIGFIDTFEFNNLPTGIIVPWAGGYGESAPTGWSLLTTPNVGVGVGFSGCYIRGAGGTVAVGSSGIGGSPNGKVSFFTTSDGLHSVDGAGGRVWPITACTGKYYANGWDPHRRAGGQAAGNHNHRLLCTPTIGYNQYQFIKATGPTEKLPSNSILLNTIHSNIPWLTQTATEGKYLRAGNRTATGETSVNIVQWADESIGILGGKHVHEWDYYQPPSIGSPGQPQSNYSRIFLSPAGWIYDGRDGYHNHEINSVTLTDNIKRAYVTAWTAAVSFYGFKGMIGFWDAALPCPAGWSVCDGTNGTIDMREHFIIMSTNANRGTRTGTNVISITPTSGNLLAMQKFSDRPLGGGELSHTHFQDSTGSTEDVDTPNPALNENTERPGTYHERRDVDHDHPLSQGLNLSFYPQYCGLYIIQKV
jgi:hypothetical protein